jgi:aryl-alcohol dehydrogenase-like predicted oxidoreductase
MPMQDAESQARRSRLVYGSVDLPDTAIAPKLLDRFYAAGGRALDVANVYRDGESAQAVGKWLRARSSPDGVVLYAKGCHPPDCDPELVEREVERAMGLLGADCLDFFILHRDDAGQPVAAWADSLLEQVARGRIGGFGVSNWTVPRLRELHGYLDGIGEDHLAVFSNHFSLAEMVSPPWPDCLALTKEELVAIADMKVEMLAWSSLAIGFFAGRDVPSWNTDANRARRQRATELGGSLGISPSAIALAYVLHQPEYVRPVVGTLSETHLDEALAAASIALSPDDVAWLETGAVSGHDAQHYSLRTGGKR